MPKGQYDLARDAGQHPLPASRRPAPGTFSRNLNPSYCCRNITAKARKTW